MTAPHFPHDEMQSLCQTPQERITHMGFSILIDAIVWGARLQAAATLRAGGYNATNADVLAEIEEGL